MLVWLKVKNLALVEEADIEFSAGYNVISGQTGAGKSVIMGALNLLLGERADKSVIRVGTEKCEIAAEFHIPEYGKKKILALLEEAGIDMEDADSILLRRVVTPSSGRNYINSVPVALPVLKSLGALLVDIHAANENQSLVHPAEQLNVLDRFANLQDLPDRVRTAYETWRETTAKQQEFLQSMPSPLEAAEMRRECSVIEKVAPVSGEDEELSKKHAIAANAKSILEISYEVSGALTESENSIVNQMGDIRRTLNQLERYDSESAEEFLSRLEEIYSNISDLSADLMDRANRVELDEGEFQALEDRMQTLQSLKRKFGPTLDDVLAYLEKIHGQLQMFDDAELLRKDWEKKVNEKYNAFLSLCKELSEKRKSVARDLEKMLSVETVKLGFAQARFAIEFAPATPGPNGSDKLQIMFSANPGVPLRPLKDVASSGEISRVMLAVKTVLAEADEIPVLVFDEIDANIGGETSMCVGAEIAHLAQKKQVICISHSPQVVRLADAHFLVQKSTDGNTTSSSIRKLDAAGRLAELTRMLGGGSAAQEHAKSLLSAEKRK